MGLMSLVGGVFRAAFFSGPCAMRAIKMGGQPRAKKNAPSSRWQTILHLHTFGTYNIPVCRVQPVLGQGGGLLLFQDDRATMPDVLPRQRGAARRRRRGQVLRVTRDPGEQAGAGFSVVWLRLHVRICVCGRAPRYVPSVQPHRVGVARQNAHRRRCFPCFWEGRRVDAVLRPHLAWAKAQNPTFSGGDGGASPIAFRPPATAQAIGFTASVQFD